MAEPILKSLFKVDKPKTEEELKEEKDKKQEELNPFLKKNLGKGQQDPEFGYSIDPKLDDYHGSDGALRIVIDNFGESVEKHYYYFVKFFTAHPKTFFGKEAKQILKLKDVFDASVSSSFHGQIGSKATAIQGQVSNYLTQIGQLTKTLLPMAREVRMMDERLEFYKNSLSDDKEEARQNEITLKSTWIEVVEQGMQNPNSVYSMATKLGFTTLPDLFFSINPHGTTIEKQRKELVREIEAMQEQYAFNKKVRDALTKKLTQYYTWKGKTFREMEHTYKFRIKNLAQHYNVIRLYTSWLKPYMTTLKALQMKGDINNYEIVGTFESSKLELELLIVLDEKNGWNSCILVRMNYITRPDLHYTSGGQRQPVHVGKIEISIEPKVATKDDIDWYQKHTDKEVLKYISGQSVDFQQTIDEMLKSLGTDIEEYIREAETGKRKKEEKKVKAPKQSVWEPFVAVKDGFKILLPPALQKGKKTKRKEADESEEAKKKMEKNAALMAWVTYDVFKKQNGMLTVV